MEQILQSRLAFDGDEAGNSKTKPAKLDSTLLKGLTILEELNESDEPLGISALDAKLDIGKSNIHRLLNGLIRLGYVEQEPSTRRYMPTLRCWEIGSHVVERDHLMRVGQPILQSLMRETRETSFLCVMSGTDLIYLNYEQDNQTKSSSIGVGARVPVIQSVAGLVLLANQPDPEGMLERIFAEEGASAAASAAHHLKEFEKIRRDGYASDIRWMSPTAPSIAVPVPRANNPPIAALGLELTPNSRTKIETKALATSLRSAAQTLASRLGGEAGFTQLFVS